MCGAPVSSIPCAGEDGGFLGGCGAAKLALPTRTNLNFNKERTRNRWVAGGIGHGPEGRELSRGHWPGTRGVRPGLTEKKVHLGKGVSFGEGTGLGKEEEGRKQASTGVEGMDRQTFAYPKTLAHKVGIETGLSG